MKTTTTNFNSTIMFEGKLKKVNVSIDTTIVGNLKVQKTVEVYLIKRTQVKNISFKTINTETFITNSITETEYHNLMITKLIEIKDENKFHAELVDYLTHI